MMMSAHKIEYPATLYHYTTISALHSIISGINKETQTFVLHATHAAWLNDLKEGAMLPDALRKCGIKEILIDRLKNMSGWPFVFSLSDLSDDLNMWRCYGANGYGVALGFNCDEIKKKFGNDLQKCKYVTENDLIETLNMTKLNPDSAANSGNCLPLAKELNGALFFKHKTFESEHEWRIVKNEISSKFKEKQNMMIPFVELELPVTALASITFGPKCDSDRNGFSVRRLLQSCCPYNTVSRLEFNQSQVPMM